MTAANKFNRDIASCISPVGGTSTAALTTRGSQISAVGEFTRAAAADQYIAGDIIADNTTGQTLATIANVTDDSGRGGMIMSATLMVDKGVLPTGWGTIRVWIYQDSITQIADNGVSTILYANRAKLAGYIDFATWVSKATDSSVSQALNVNLPFVTAVTSLYFVVETISALTSDLALGTKFSLSLDVLKA